MNRSADVIVIGAGVMGASVAWHLSQMSDLHVIVVDSRGPLGGMSGRTFGQVRQHYSNALTLEMARYGVDFFADWQKRVGLGASGYVAMGYLLCVVESQLGAAERNVDLARSLGIETEMVSPRRIAQIEPAINPDGLSGGAWDPAGGYIDVTRITLSWLAAAQQSGRVELLQDSVRAVTTTNGSISGVETDTGTLSAPHVVCAAGPWTTELVPQHIPLEARRLDTMYMSLPPQTASLRTCVTDGNSNIVVRPDMGATFLAAAYPPEMELVDDPLVEPSPDSDAAHLARIRAALAERFPACQDAQPVRSLCGSYDITPDWHPILGSSPGLDGLHLACGFSGHGLKLAPAVGRVLAESVLGVPTYFDIAPLRLSRFADNEPMYLAYGPGGRA